MPVIFSRLVNPDTSLCIWHITETEEELSRDLFLTEEDKKAILSSRLSKRRLERFACRKALAFLLNDNCIAISYSNTGKPSIPHHEVSFSHSGKYAAVAISSTRRIGIDIEVNSPKITLLHSKFINARELNSISAGSTEDFHYFWGAKEAIYKIFGEGLDFLKDIEVDKSSHSAIVKKQGAVENIRLYHWIETPVHLVLAILT